MPEIVNFHSMAGNEDRLEPLEKRRPQNLEWSVAQVKNHLQHYPGSFLIQESELFAFILYFENADILEISYLETGAEHRRKGWMEHLLVHWLARFPGKQIWLDVHHKNLGALQLYLKLGFKYSGLRKRYYRDRGDCLLLSREAFL